MPNHLVNENSPYLLQHAENPVEWYPWGEEALERARLEHKPIFLSIGYAACHWCHVMAHESFEDTQTAAFMNEHFINIKVDREERPDLDGIYMQAVMALTGQGGWPMSVFLTPNLQPFYGGTYFPPVRRYNMPSFRELLSGVVNAWQNEHSAVAESAENIADHMRKSIDAPTGESTFTAQDLQKVTLLLAQGYDWKNGGWGQAPKFPQPMAVEFLLRRAVQGDVTARDIAFHCLSAMHKGGMYDIVGCGFARYSTDDHWLIPHFEKMLYDNAQLALAYLHGYLASGDTTFRQTCEHTLEFITRELHDQEGGFYASLDADSEGEEGKFYVWSLPEIREALKEKSDLYIAAYGITEGGNFEGRNVLQRVLDTQALSAQFGLEEKVVGEELEKASIALRSIRNKRIRPATDDKILTSWNGLTLTAFAEAARYLSRPDFLLIAQQSASFLLDYLITDNRLMRSWRDGQARHKAYLEDYAALILGLLALYQTDSQTRWYKAAEVLIRQMVDLFYEPGVGFFDTGRDHEALLIRPRDLWDNATPCGGSLAAQALLQIGLISGHGDWRDMAEASLSAIRPNAMRYPTGLANWLAAADFAIAQIHEVALIGASSDPSFQALQAALWSRWRPHLVAAASPFPPADGSPALLYDRNLLGGAPTVYVCQNFFCQRPVATPEDLEALLKQNPSPLPGN